MVKMIPLQTIVRDATPIIPFGGVEKEVHFDESILKFIMFRTKIKKNEDHYKSSG